MIKTLTKQTLVDKGWKDMGDIAVLYTSPRIGWKEDGTLIVGYYEYNEPVFTLKKLKQILYNYNISIYAKRNRLTN